VPVAADYRAAPRFIALGEGFADIVRAAGFPRRTLRFRNQRWAERVGLGALDPQEWDRHFAQFEPLPDNLGAPLAMRYHGHQFGVYNPALGDGRGFLFAQVRDARDDTLRDLGTKGSGRTPYSRGGDGRLTLQGGVREVLASEMLEALGVPTCKAFSMFETGERLWRNDEPSPTRSSVLVRLSHSHVRFGSFQRHAYEGRGDRVRALFAHVVAEYMPHVRSPGELLAEVARRTADTCAAWMVAGFVHGVLNTDNMNVTGESFDYGPYRFLPRYDPMFIAAYFDESGLYAFGRQPEAVAWNLLQFAKALAVGFAREGLDDALGAFQPAFEAAVRRRVLERLGLASRGDEADDTLVGLVYAFLRDSAVGYDRFFFDAHGGDARADKAMASSARVHYAGAAWDALRRAMGRYGPAHADVVASAYFAREDPCTLLIDEIEAIWQRIEAFDDWSSFDAKIADIRSIRGACVPSSP
jgi:uncharacterized protein YdiU (UPF0061 family)